MAAFWRNSGWLASTATQVGRIATSNIGIIFFIFISIFSFSIWLLALLKAAGFIFHLHYFVNTFEFLLGMELECFLKLCKT
jgi:hypothetical protein